MEMKKLGIAAAAFGAALAVGSFVVRCREAASIGIIGGADGPTAIFVAGEPLGLISGVGAALGILILAVGAVMICKRKK